MVLNNEREQKSSFHKSLVDTYIIATCLNCVCFADNICVEAGETPPPKVIVFGCPKWEANVPF